MEGRPPAISGRDSFRVVMRCSDGSEREFPALTDLGIPRAISRLEELGYVFLRAERLPDANGSGGWPWEPWGLPTSIPEESQLTLEAA